GPCADEQWIDMLFRILPAIQAAKILPQSGLQQEGRLADGREWPTVVFTADGRIAGEALTFLGQSRPGAAVPPTDGVIRAGDAVSLDLHPDNDPLLGHHIGRNSGQIDDPQRTGLIISS